MSDELKEHKFSSRMQGTIADYHHAPGGEGPLASEWKDKPHRLLYDLLGEIQALQASCAALQAENDRLRLVLRNAIS